MIITNEYNNWESREFKRMKNFMYNVWVEKYSQVGIISFQVFNDQNLFKQLFSRYFYKYIYVNCYYSNGNVIFFTLQQPNCVARALSTCIYTSDGIFFFFSKIWLFPLDVTHESCIRIGLSTIARSFLFPQQIYFYNMYIFYFDYLTHTIQLKSRKKNIYFYFSVWIKRH